MFKSTKGFTYIELMITVAVVTLAMLGYVAANMSMQRSQDIFHDRAVAIQDANQVIEMIRDTSKTGTFPGNVTGAYPNGGTVAGFTNLNNEQITVNHTTIVNSAGSATDELLDVTVTVTWLDRRGDTATEELRTLVDQREIS